MKAHMCWDCREYITLDNVEEEDNWMMVFNSKHAGHSINTFKTDVIMGYSDVSDQMNNLVNKDFCYWLCPFA